MSPSHNSLTPSQAAARLGVSMKALRLYEQRGLIVPDRTVAGWRTYGPRDLARATEVISLRALGLSLTQIARVIDGDPSDLEDGLVAHETRLMRQAQQIASALQRVRKLRSEILQGLASDPAGLAVALDSGVRLSVRFELPWPWAGEWFELRQIRPLNFITGPLGSGKTRFAERLAASLPHGKFLGLDRLGDSTIARRLSGDAALADRVERRLAWLVGAGAERSDALLALVTALEAHAARNLVVDMVEQGLNERTQEALIAHLGARPWEKRVLFLMTRSSAILDLDAIGGAEPVILCPANHSPAIRIEPYPGGRGYEAAATCLATPDVRARTAGVIARVPDAA